MRETSVRSLGWQDAVEKEMAPHSSTLAWKIPWTEEHGRLQSMGWQRVGHDRATLLFFVIQPIKHVNACVMIFKINKFIYLFLAVLGLCCWKGFLSFREWELLSSCGAWACHYGGFSCCRAWALGPVGFISCIPWALEHRLSSHDEGGNRPSWTPS